MRAFAWVLVLVGASGCFSPMGNNSSATTEGGPGSASETEGMTSTSPTGTSTSTSTSGEPTTGPSATATATGLPTDATTAVMTDPSGGTTDATGMTGEPFCGDGVILEGVEQCDDGNQKDGDECLNNCALAVCGDGVLYEGVEQCDDGNLSEGDGCNAMCGQEGSPLTPRYVFVTSKKYTAAEVGKLELADLECEALAGAVGASPVLAGRNFKAWLSDSKEPAEQRIGKWLGEYVLPDGALVVVGSEGLLLGVLTNAIGLDEKGLTVPVEAESCQVGSEGVWTGTSTLGTAVDGQTCDDWSANSGLGVIGSFAAKDSAWTQCATRQCATPFRLYCVEVE
ncbi:DUF4215 domain-containing cysteine-rich repeat protein [Nannocystis sp. SCPEA4]|uniref:DUF4215 domain-containing cysteine-rich repeat protein n=1 Tax=Nannocystis sp. SCPEA4 TaxID=2996787 RepID=UPI00226DAFD0|nr:DUF4215 domain-containing cysteine-rich repeat protein [Nannocystis sp. SCPEA4]MCY1059860.1 DUF4215 domain-containing protein [Nannocystis sp. SCPEA4]